jgi:hypothetical protein
MGTRGIGVKDHRDIGSTQYLARLLIADKVLKKHFTADEQQGLQKES